jgi:putative ABC transport system permease protein
MRGLWRDLLVSLRLFRRSPGLAAGVAVIIGLGVGGSMAIFALLYSGLVPPSPFRDPSRLVVVENTGRYYFGGHIAEGLASPYVSVPDYRDLESQVRTLSQVGAAVSYSGIMRGGDRPRPVWRTLVTPRLLPLLAPRARLGRVLNGDDFKTGAAAAAMITESMWRSYFGAEPAVVGRTIHIDDQPFTLAGVLPDSALRFLRQPAGVLEESRDEWAVSPLLAPLAGSEAFMVRYSERNRDAPSLTVVGRMAPGRSLTEVQSEVVLVGRRLAAANPDANKGRGLQAHGLEDWRVSKVRGTMNMLLAAAVLVFLVAAANAAGLILADGVRHETETAVRQALGAAPARLMVTELVRAIVLALPGGLLAIVVATLTLAAVDRTVGGGTGAIPRALLLPRVATVGLLYTVLAGLVGGAAAAWSQRRRNVAESLKEGGLTTSFGRRRHVAMRVFVAVQIAAATALVLDAGLMVRSVWNIVAVDLGFDVRHGLVMQLRLPPAAYPKGADQRAFIDQAIRRVRAIPGVAAAGIAVAPPLSNASQSMSGLELDTPQGTRAPDRVNVRSVMTGYLEALDMKLVRGRWFDDADARGESSGALVDPAFCRKYLAGMDPLAVKVRLGRQVVPIVGVVGDVRASGPLEDIEPTLYLFEGFERPARFLYLVVRARGNPADVSAATLREVLAGDPNVSVDDPKTVNELFSATFAARRRLLVLLGSAAVMVLLLTAFALVSALSQFVAGRRRDIAIRLSLGAERRHVALLLTRHVAVAVAVGLVVGAAAGLALARTLSSQLFGLQPADLRNVAAALAVLAVLSTLAAVVPVWRASRIDPTTTLRAQ